MSNVGFSGTRHGMTEVQLTKVSEIIRDRAKRLSHGDCIGSDAQAHAIAFNARIPIHLHPPENEVLRAFCSGAEVEYEPKPYNDRNRDIVDKNDFLLAAPDLRSANTKSGTWSTIRYAMKRGKPVYVVFPDGSSEER